MAANGKQRWDPRLFQGNLLIMLISTFLLSFGNGLQRGAATNFFVDTFGMDGGQVLWLQGLREVPGLALMFIAALIMHLPLVRRAAYAVVVMGVGYGLYAVVGSYPALVGVAMLASLGFHVWTPLQRALAMGLVERDFSGRVLGVVTGARSLAEIVGMGALALATGLLTGISLRWYYVAGGVFMVLAGFLLLRIPNEAVKVDVREPRLLLRRKYWVYYALSFLEGSRIQIFHTFGTLILVQNYGLKVWEISLLLLLSSVANLVGGPLLGDLLDRVGERKCMSVSYVALAACFAGYATLHNTWMLGALLVAINLLTTLTFGLSTYVRRIAPAEEMTPTLSAGVSINHITSVGVSLLAGSLLALVGYEALLWGAVVILLLSVPFALAMRTQPEPKPAPAGASAQ
jgi:predicted MFS family arabinose efflux permease